MPKMMLTLFSGFAAEVPPGTLLALPTKKAKALLAYCALNHGQVQHRDKLATLLWGDRGEQQARNCLRQTLFVLRSALGNKGVAFLRAQGDTIVGDPAAIEVDVLRFERLAAERTPAALEQAAALYRGDLLEGFVVNAEPFERWLAQESERLRDLQMEVLARLLRHQKEEEPPAAAIRTARRLLALDPFAETVHRALMCLHVRAGRREAALRQYELCRRMLMTELRVEEEPETRRLYEAISTREFAPPVTGRESDRVPAAAEVVEPGSTHDGDVAKPCPARSPLLPSEVIARSRAIRLEGIKVRERLRQSLEASRSVRAVPPPPLHEYLA